MGARVPPQAEISSVLGTKVHRKEMLLMLVMTFLDIFLRPVWEFLDRNSFNFHITIFLK